jgi:hypothetical protein
MGGRKAMRRAQCLGKVRYTRVQDGIFAIADMNSRDGYEPMDVYHCQFCGSFHVGHRRAA